MDDIILKSYLNDFASRFDYTSEKESLQFEHFAAYCLVAKDYQAHFDAEDLSAGEANGIDSVAVFVNDFLITSAAEIDGLARHSIEVRFLFIQSKTSASYDQGDILKFTQAVRFFFSKETKPVDYPLVDYHDIKEAIYKKAIKFSENPRIDLRYVATSSGRPNTLLTDTANRETELLKDTGLFSVAQFDFYNAEDLKAIYRNLSNKITKQVAFEKHTILPKIQGVKRAYIGILPCKEYLKLICDESGRLLKNVFYDNVRDFQGDNAVNREILSTITSDEAGRETFVLLNNGVTVVCKSINPVGVEFTVRDFQVVNGCQTSHVLHRNQDILSGNEFVIIKLIETEDADLTNRITKATNRQTEVKLEAFAGLQPFHKELEAFYSSIEPKERLYYERRPGQFDFDSNASQRKVVSIPSQIKSFVSVFLEEPQKIHFYYGQLLNDYSSGNESALFAESHDPFPYYAASRLVFLVNERLRQRARPQLKWKYHLAAMIRMLSGGPFNVNRLSDSAHCKRYCESLQASSADFGTHFDTAVGLLAEALNARAARRNFRDLPQDADMAKELLSDCRKDYLQRNMARSKVAKSEIEKFDGTYVGSIAQIVKEKQFGFIIYGQRRFYFALANGHHSPGSKVRFRLRKSGDSWEAFDVVPL
jgi:AIPR protein